LDDLQEAPADELVELSAGLRFLIRGQLAGLDIAMAAATAVTPPGCLASRRIDAVPDFGFAGVASLAFSGHLILWYFRLLFGW
jgi:hypothetical protein